MPLSMALKACDLFVLLCFLYSVNLTWQRRHFFGKTILFSNAIFLSQTPILFTLVFHPPGKMPDWRYEGMLMHKKEDRSKYLSETKALTLKLSFQHLDIRMSPVSRNVARHLTLVFSECLLGCRPPVLTWVGPVPRGRDRDRERGSERRIESEKERETERGGAENERRKERVGIGGAKSMYYSLSPPRH